MVYLSAPVASAPARQTVVRPAVRQHSAHIRHLRVVPAQPQPAQPQPAQPQAISQVQLLQAVMEGFVDGILLVNAQGEILESNSRAREIFQSFSSTTQMPEQIWQVCEALVASQNLFPGQPVVPEAEVAIAHFNLRVRVRWINVTGAPEDSCMLVTLEDRHQTIHNQAIADTQKYELTAREAEIWQMRLEGQSYQAIASQLYITQNTVKKHVKNILAKRREEV
jgi:DNA-binding CsgD family transcriptional regulator